MPQDKVDVARRAVDAFNRRDLDCLFAELATPDLEFYPGTVRALGGDEHRGREGFEQFDRARSENWEELQNVAEELRDLGDRVVVLGTTKGRGRASRAAVEVPYAAQISPLVLVVNVVPPVELFNFVLLGFLISNSAPSSALSDLLFSLMIFNAPSSSRFVYVHVIVSPG